MFGSLDIPPTFYFVIVTKSGNIYESATVTSNGSREDTEAYDLLYDYTSQTVPVIFPDTDGSILSIAPNEIEAIILIDAEGRDDPDDDHGFPVPPGPDPYGFKMPIPHPDRMYHIPT